MRVILYTSYCNTWVWKQWYFLYPYKNQPDIPPLATISHEMFNQYTQQLLSFLASFPLNPSTHAERATKSQGEQFPIVEPSKIRWCGLLYTYCHQISVIVHCKMGTGRAKQESVKLCFLRIVYSSQTFCQKSWWTFHQVVRKRNVIFPHKIHNSKGPDTRLLKKSVHTQIQLNSFTSYRVLIINNVNKKNNVVQHKAYFLIQLNADSLYPFACWSLAYPDADYPDADPDWK